MTRRQVPLAVVIGAAIGLIGAALASRPFVAAVVGGMIAAVIAVVLRRATRRRLATLAARASDLTRQRRSRGASGPADPDPAWRELGEALDRAGSAVGDRLDDLADQRARVLGILERLPPAILLFGPGGLSYANVAGRSLFRLDAHELHPAGRLTPMQALGMQVLADAVERTASRGTPEEVEAPREDRIFFARTSRTTHGEVALVLTDLTEARRLDAVRRDFVTNASHELKTPVAGIQALADSLALAAERDPQRAARMIGRMQTEATRLATLVRELLDLARLEELGDARPTARIDLAAVARQHIERVLPAAAERSVQLRSSLADGAWVEGSPEDLRLIVDNLLQNAIRYNRPDGTVDVRVHAEAGRVVLEVRDTGIGIPEADRERVFERFYRVDMARSRAAGGTGLGLSLVRHATQRLGGSVSLSSTLGQGSTFRVDLPAAPDT